MVWIYKTVEKRNGKASEEFFEDFSYKEKKLDGEVAGSRREVKG